MAMTPIPALDRTSATFRTDVDTFFGTRIPAFVTEANALQTDVNAAAADAIAAAATADSDAGIATAQAALALSSAQTAINAPGTSATSGSSISVGVGTVPLVIQTGKSLVAGQFVVCARTSDPTTYMIGQIASYNAGTGDLTVSVASCRGSGTYSDWTIALSAVTDSSHIGVKYGVETVVLSTAATQVALAVLTESQAVYLYRVAGGVCARTINISGGGLSVGAEHVIDASTGTSISITRLSDTSAVATYLTTALALKAVVLSVSGTAVGHGTIFTVVTDARDMPVAITAVSSVQCVAVWTKFSTATPQACTLNITGTTINSAGSAITVSSITSSGIDVVALDGTHVFVVIGDTTGASIYSNRLTISGTSLSAPTSVPISESGGSHFLPKVVKNGANTVVVWLGSGTVAGTGTQVAPIQFATDGTYVSARQQLMSGNSGYPVPAMPTPDHLFVSAGKNPGVHSIYPGAVSAVSVIPDLGIVGSSRVVLTPLICLMPVSRASLLSIVLDSTSSYSYASLVEVN